MTSLKDIVPETPTLDVVVSGKDGPMTVKVRGITGRRFATMLRRFPDLARQSAGMPVDPSDNLAIGFDLVPVLIAGGFDRFGDEEAEDLADQLQPEDQRKLCEAVWKLTFPKAKKNPFSEAAESQPDDAAEPGKGPDTK